MLELLEVNKDQDYDRFIHRFKRKTDIDLHLYKEEQMKRRLNAFKTRKGYDNFDDLYQSIMVDHGLFIELLNHMTINVTEFFRNPNRWEMLEDEIIPKLLSQNNTLKCWSAACSTGEEPYSLAMILSSISNLRFRILATDLNERVLNLAKKGVYKESAMKNVSVLQMNTFFRQENEEFFISSALKKHVEFRKQNLLSDPFEQNFDLIICRNVLIYFTDEAKDLLYHKFSKALRKGGYLFVGGSEQIFRPNRYQFKEAGTFFYKKV